MTFLRQYSNEADPLAFPLSFMTILIPLQSQKSAKLCDTSKPDSFQNNWRGRALLISCHRSRSHSSLRSDDEKKKKRRSYNPKREPAIHAIDKEEHIRQLEKRLQDLTLKNREVKTLRSELSDQRRKYKELEELYHQNRLMWLIATGCPPSSLCTVELIPHCQG
jgi:hypothetical protein